MDSLATAIAEAYRAFPDTGPSGPLLVCHCMVCMSPEMARSIATTPRARLSATQIGEYLNSAHDAGDPVAIGQLRWLLPRMLECCVTGPWPYSMTEYTFAKLGSAGLATWPQAERAAVRQVFIGLLAEALAATRAGGGDRPEHLVEAFVRGGEPIGPYLEHWDADRSEAATVALAELIAWRLTYASGKASLRRGESWGSPAETAAFIAFIDRPETVARLQAAFFVASEPAVADLLSIAHQVLAPRG